MNAIFSSRYFYLFQSDYDDHTEIEKIKEKHGELLRENEIPPQLNFNLEDKPRNRMKYFIHHFVQIFHTTNEIMQKIAHGQLDTTPGKQKKKEDWKALAEGTLGNIPFLGKLAYVGMGQGKIKLHLS